MFIFPGLVWPTANWPKLFFKQVTSYKVEVGVCQCYPLWYKLQFVVWKVVPGSRENVPEKWMHLSSRPVWVDAVGWW